MRMQLESRFSSCHMQLKQMHIFNNENEWAGEFHSVGRNDVQISARLRCRVYVSSMQEQFKVAGEDRMKTGVAQSPIIMMQGTDAVSGSLWKMKQGLTPDIVITPSRYKIIAEKMATLQIATYATGEGVRGAAIIPAQFPLCPYSRSQLLLYIPSVPNTHAYLRVIPADHLHLWDEYRD